MKIEKKALKALLRMPAEMRQRFYKAFEDIENHNEAHLDIKLMKGSNVYKRLRIGQYRAIYTLDLEIIVIDAGPRGDIYK